MASRGPRVPGDRGRVLAHLLAGAALMSVCAGLLHAQQLLDRILARVGTQPITQTDVALARGLGLVDAIPGEDADASAVRQLVERVLMLQEVARLQVREPTPEAIELELARLRARTVGSFDRLLATTGYDLAAVRELARESLRIEAYLQQRFGPSATPRDADVRAWLADLRSRARVEIVPARR